MRTTALQQLETGRSVSESGALRLLLSAIIMASDPNQQADTSLFDLFSECRRSFELFLLAVEGKSCCVEGLNRFSFSDVIDQSAAARLWDDQANSDGSNEPRIWQDSDIKCFIRPVLRRLYDALDQGTLRGLSLHLC